MGMPPEAGSNAFIHRTFPIPAPKKGFSLKSLNPKEIIKRRRWSDNVDDETRALSLVGENELIRSRMRWGTNVTLTVEIKASKRKMNMICPHRRLLCQRRRGPRIISISNPL